MTDHETADLFKIVESCIIKSDYEVSIPLCLIIAVAQGWPKFKNWQYWGTVKRTRKEIRQQLNYMAERGALEKVAAKPTTYFYGPKYLELLRTIGAIRHSKEKRELLKKGTVDYFLFDVIDQNEAEVRTARLKSILNLE